MIVPKTIFENPDVVDYLINRKLLEQYKKSKNKLLNGTISGLDFKERMPKGSKIFAFRINKQFRAIGYFDGPDFVVAHIDNHQN